MPGPFTVGELADAGEVGQPRLPRTLTLAGLDDGGTLGLPSVQIEYALDASPPAGAPSHSTVLPEVAVQLVDMDHQHVGWLPNMLGGASARRSLGDPGAVQVPLSRTDTALASIDFEDTIVRYWLRGNLIAAGLVGPRDDATIAPGEEADQTVAIGGAGTLAILGEATVDPWKLDWFPDSNAHRFNFAHPDYDDSAWGPAYTKAVQGGWSPHWVGFPRGWMDPAAEWISGPLGNSGQAPPGHTYYRCDFNLATGGAFALMWTGDNTAQMFIDGVEISTINNWQQLQRIDLDLSPGDHVMAALVGNATDDGEPGGNPSALLVSLFQVGEQGRLTSVVFRSQAAGWKVLQYPTAEPGWTPTKIVRYLLTKWAGRGGRTISTSFTDTADSAGQAVPSIPDTTIQVGSTLLQAVEQIAENYLDIQMAPGSWTLHAYNKGTLGRDLDLTLAGPDLTTTALASVASLRHKTSAPLATSLLVRWQDNWLRRTITPAGQRRRERHLQLPTVRSAAGAQRIADSVLEVFGRVRTEYQAEIVPRSDAQVPGIAVQEGDTVRLPSKEGTLTSVRVQSWSVSCDEDGLVGFQIEAGDRIAEGQERMENWLARMADGAIGGQTLQALPDRFDRFRYSASTIVAREKSFHRLATDDVGESDPWTMSAPGILTDYTVDLPDGDGAAFSVLVNGTVVDSVTVSAGVTSEDVVGLAVTVERGDQVSVSTTSAVAAVVNIRVS